MNERDLEQLLRERGERLREASALSGGAAASLHGELERDALGGRRRSTKLRLLTGALAVAAAVTLLVTKPWQQDDFGQAECQLALLDLDGRELASSTRSTPEEFERPEALLVEVVATEPAFLHIQLVDAHGVFRTVDLGAERAGPLGAGEDKIIRVDLSGLESLPSGESEGTVLLISSREEIPAARIAALLPTRLESTTGMLRAFELRNLALDLADELGCTTRIHGFILDRREP